MSERVWPVRVTVVPYALLAFLTAVTVLVRRTDPRAMLVDLVLCAAAALWMLLMFTLRPGPARAVRTAWLVFITGFVLIMAVLVVRDSWFGFLTPAGYFYAFVLLPWPSRLVPASRPSPWSPARRRRTTSQDRRASACSRTSRCWA